MAQPVDGRKVETVGKRRCHRCHGSGRSPCPICAGRGEVVRGADPQGRPVFDRCGGCFGIKTTRCSTCGGDGLA